MKRALTIFALIGATVVFFGCTKASNNTNNNSPASYKMTATVNGAAFSADSCSFSRYYPPDSSYEISTGSAYPNIVLYLYKYQGTGTYSISGSSSKFAANYNIPSEYYLSTGGSATVTSVSATAITGTFSFTAAIGTDSVAVTNGTFTAQIQ